MSLQEMIAEIPRLTLAERIAVLEVVTKTLKDEVTINSLPNSYRGVPAEKVLGVIKFADGHVPDDAEIDDLVYESLMEKHGK